MAANDPGAGAGAATPAATVPVLVLLAVVRWLATSAPTAPPPMLPTTSPAASMAAAMLRAGRWGKGGTALMGCTGAAGSGAIGVSMKSGVNGSRIVDAHAAPER